MGRNGETHLGDGVYASFDGYQVWLRVERCGADHVIALEPGTLAALNDYVRRLTEAGRDALEPQP